ncbi:hypothetical protein OFY05_11210 [Pseudocitrobacter faecalis]|nr:hypothetical protein OFY05_11210 [Pseudocitrobacter faecalis]
MALRLPGLQECSRRPGKTCALSSFQDGANMMYIIDAIMKSHQQQRWVRVVD